MEVYLFTLGTAMADKTSPNDDKPEINLESGRALPSNYIADSSTGPVVSEACTLPADLLSFHHSFGYDCKSLHNLTVADRKVLIFVTGSYLHIYRTKTGELTCHRSCRATSISRVTKNPLKPHLAIAERGEDPLILICHWPSFQVLHALENGAQQGYCYLEYNPKGDLLLSQSSTPDFLVTVWVWEKAEVLFRCKAYERDVYCVHFSGFFNHQLVSTGASHIKFWNMNDTFTGQKLQGELGRFGKTEACDLVSALPLPDGTFASGSSWGNILIWDEGVIRLEVFRTGGLRCHTAEITQLVFSNSSLLTAGLDGAVRLWNYETIEMADPPEDAPFMEMEPHFELIVMATDAPAQLVNLVKASAAPEDTTWFAQDQAGAIWNLDITTHADAKLPKTEFICHSGPVLAVQTSPAEDFFASLGTDGQIYIYNFKEKKIDKNKEFAYSGRCLIWLPLSMAPAGKGTVGGFDDGVVRLIMNTPSGIQVAQALKPHTKAVTALAFTETEEDNLLVSGSEDGTIFFYHVIPKTVKTSLKLESIGVCPVNSPVTCLLWSPVSLRHLWVGCMDGRVLHYSVSETLAPSSKDTNLIILTPQTITVEMVLRGLIELETLPTNDKQQDEDGTMEYFGATDVQELEEDPCLVSGPVLFLWNSPYDTIWVSFEGVRPGTIFEYDFYKLKLIRGLNIMPTYPGEVHCCLYSAKNDCLFLGYSNGRIAAVHPQQANEDFLHYQVHNSVGDTINNMCFNFDERYLFTCGGAGSVFCFQLPPSFGTEKPRPELCPFYFVQISPDIDGKSAISVEELQLRKNYEEKVRMGEEHKMKVKAEVAELQQQYKQVLEANAVLPESLRLSDEELVPDSRIVDDMTRMLDKEGEETRMKLVRETERSELLLKKLRNYLIDDMETLTVRIECIEYEDFVESFRLAKLGEDFEDLMKSVKQRLFDMDTKGREQSVAISIGPTTEKVVEDLNLIDALLKHVSTLGDIGRNFQLCRLYDKYCKRRAEEKSRSQVWKDFMTRKPNLDQMDPSDVLALEMARENLGDLILKTSPEYKVPKHLKVSTLSKTLSLLEAKQRMYNLKHSFNCKVLDLRRRKQEILKKHTMLREDLNVIYKGIPEHLTVAPPDLPQIDVDIEFPERKLTFIEEDVLNELYLNAKPQRKSSDRRRRKTLATLPMVDIKKKFQGDPYKMEISQLQELSKSGNYDSAWELELENYESHQINLMKQGEIVTEMTQDITDFDRDVYLLRDEKIRVDADAKFLEIYILTISREVHILKDFEGEEGKKSKSVLSSLKEKDDLQKSINETLLRIDLRLKEIQNSEDEIRILVSKYFSSIADNKYFDFLKKIFKKRFKAPKPEDADSDDSSSSDDDTESDEGDDKSLDSKDVNIFDMDENVCPAGCDRALYELTFTSRAQRHVLESNVVEKKKEVETLKKYVDVSSKQMLVLDKSNIIAQKDLEEFQREKQVKLNEIETLVVLVLDQFQNLRDDETLEGIVDSVVLSADLLAKLHNRGSALEKETMQQKDRHAQNRQHIQRMAIDIRYMAQVIKDKEKDTKETMMRKFGSIVDLNELEESLLKKLVAEMGFISFEFEKELIKGLGPLQDRLNRRKETYANRLKQNTERFNIIALLNEEKSRIDRVLEAQNIKIELPPKEENLKDIEKLEKVVCKQKRKLAWLYEEIHAIKFKHTIRREAEKMAVEEISSETRLIMTSIRTVDGMIFEVSEMLKLELKTLLEDIDELSCDIEGGFVTQEGASRLKSLIDEYVEKMPMKAFKAMFEELDDENNSEKDMECAAAAAPNLDNLLSKAKLILEMAPDFEADELPIGDILKEEGEVTGRLSGCNDEL